MENIIIKTENDDNKEIIVLYVDESNGGDGILTINPQIETENYIIDGADATEIQLTTNDQTIISEDWSDEEVSKLLMFYIDNKETFLNGSTKKEFLWSIGCRTMLPQKNEALCEAKLNYLKEIYTEILVNLQLGITAEWPYFDLCHEAFYDDNYAEVIYEKAQQKKQEMQYKSNNDGIIYMKKNSNRPPGDPKVEMMLDLYLKHKKNLQKNVPQKALWEIIATEMGDEDPEYWHRRFVNFKQHYTRLLDKRDRSGEDNINWPYMERFDKIFEGDDEFKRHYITITEDTNVVINNEVTEKCGEPLEWDRTETTVLAKYCFDCFDEFQDATISNTFLWTEVGRLLNKKPDDCRTKYNELKNEHLDKYIAGEYNLTNRKPIDIIFDNIISKEIYSKLSKDVNQRAIIWKTEETDELVQFIYNNIELFKDRVCYFVCWTAIGRILKKSIRHCKKHWDELLTFYKGLLRKKMENPDQLIDWRYIELFDRMFDYGMDIKFIEEFENYGEKKRVRVSERIGVKKVNITLDDDKKPSIDDIDDDEDFDEKENTYRKKSTGDPKAYQILEYYLKNKAKFLTSPQTKLWAVLGKEIGVTATECGHRFRNFKQIYKKYLQREIDKPEMPILWPYYSLCKKVFGYRALKTKMKKVTYNYDEWSSKDIKSLVKFVVDYFGDIDANVDDLKTWTRLANEIGRTDITCREKFLELRRYYKIFKNKSAQNPNANLTWKYYKLFEDAFNSDAQNMMETNVNDLEEMNFEDDKPQDDEEYQCIIVLPEGQELEDMKGVKVITQVNGEVQQIKHLDNTAIKQEVSTSRENIIAKKWTKRMKKQLLTLFLEYAKTHKDQEISRKDMWIEISSKLENKTPLSCRKMFLKLKKIHLKSAKTGPNEKRPLFYTLFQKILSFKLKFKKVDTGKVLNDMKTYEDVAMSTEKIHLGLQYYLEHIEEFLSPKYEKKYIWSELANFISEPLMKVFNKISYLKQQYKEDSELISIEVFPFGQLLKEICEKEKQLEKAIEEPKLEIKNDDVEIIWTDDEIEKLLIWYLGNLDKFKNPKFVRKYLWMEISSILQKNPLACSKKMLEIRSQYRNIVKDQSEELCRWKFYDLCQKIYGTGKKGSIDTDVIVTYVNVPSMESIVNVT